MPLSTFTDQRTFYIYGNKVRSPQIEIPAVKWEEIDGKRQRVEHTRLIEFFTRDGMLYCSDPFAVDYYHTDVNGRDVGMWIYPDLMKWADENGFYWEWENAECISLCC